jgi:hypothetical protein
MKIEDREYGFQANVFAKMTKCSPGVFELGVTCT